MIVEFEGYQPRIHPSAFIAPTAVLIGNVVVEENASVWYGAVLRADHGDTGIVIGAGSNVQDNCVLHVAEEHPTVVGRSVTIGHGALMEGCAIDDGALIGMNAVILEGVRIGNRALVAANSTVLAGTQVPPEVVVAGSPATVKKQLEGAARWWIEGSGEFYVELSRRYLTQGLGEAL